MSLIVTFACGHHATTDGGGGSAPMCEVCHEHRVRSVRAPVPRFRGVASGPCTEYVDLPARAVRLTDQKAST